MTFNVFAGTLNPTLLLLLLLVWLRDVKLGEWKAGWSEANRLCCVLYCSCVRATVFYTAVVIVSCRAMDLSLC